MNPFVHSWRLGMELVVCGWGHSVNQYISNRAPDIIVKECLDKHRCLSLGISHVQKTDNCTLTFDTSEDIVTMSDS